MPVKNIVLSFILLFSLFSAYSDGAKVPDDTWWIVPKSNTQAVCYTNAKEQIALSIILLKDEGSWNFCPEQPRKCLNPNVSCEVDAEDFDIPICSRGGDAISSYSKLSWEPRLDSEGVNIGIPVCWEALVLAPIDTVRASEGIVNDIKKPSNNSRYFLEDIVHFSTSAKEDYLNIHWYAALEGGSDGKIGDRSNISKQFNQSGRYKIRVKAVVPDKPRDWSTTDSIFIDVFDTPTIAIKDKNSKYAVYTESENIQLEVDVLQSALSNATVTWRSNLDGEIGAGELLQTNNLSLGEHAISVTLKGTFNGKVYEKKDNITIEVIKSPTARISTPINKAKFLKAVAIPFLASATFRSANAFQQTLQWHSSIDGNYATGLASSYSALSVGAHTVKFTNTIQYKGRKFEAIDQISVEVLDPPKIEIVWPIKNAIYLKHQPITLKADSLWRDKPLSGQQIEWHSSADGILGYGSELVVDDLTVNLHDIQVGIDPEGFSANDSVGIEVKEETFDENLGSQSNCEGQSFFGNPINLQTGNKVEKVVDYISNGQFPLAIVRTYNSFSESSGVFGRKWSSNLDLSVKLFSERDEVVVSAIDGSGERFKKSGNLWVPANKNSTSRSTLVQQASIWTYTVSSGEKYVYDSQGRLLSRTNIKGYSQQYEYQGGQLKYIRDDLNRVIELFYQAGQISSVKTPNGTEILYRYKKDRPILEKVIYPQTAGHTKEEARTVNYLYENLKYPEALTGIKNELGIQISTWKYDGFGRAYFSSKGQGETFEKNQIEYVAYGESITTNAFGKKANFKFTGVNGVLKTERIDGIASTHCSATTASHTYYPSGWIKSKTDNNGNVTVFTYNNRGLIESRSVYGAESIPENGNYSNLTPDYYEQTKWQADIPKPDIVNQPGIQIDYDYYDNHNIRKITYRNTKKIAADGAIQTDFSDRIVNYSYTYYDDKRVKSMVVTTNAEYADGATDRKIYNYDAVGNVTKIQYPYGLSEHFRYEGAIPGYTQHIDANNVTTNYQYNNRGWLEHITQSHGGKSSQTSYQFYANGQTKSVTQPNGYEESYRYNSAGYLTHRYAPDGAVFTTVPDTMGGWKSRSIKDSSGKTVYSISRTPDELGRTHRMDGANGQWMKYSYDGNGNVTLTTTAMPDDQTQQIQRKYDWQNRVILEEPLNQAIGYRTAYQYQDGALTRVTLSDLASSKVVATDYTYNGFGDLLLESSPDRGATYYQFNDKHAQPSQKTDARGISIQYEYDALNRQKQIVYPKQHENVTYFYDDTSNGNYGRGRLTSIHDNTGVLKYKFNYLGQTTEINQTLGSAEYYSEYNYTDFGQLRHYIYPSGRKLEYFYDSQGRIEKLQENKQGSIQVLASNIEYKPFGSMSHIEYGNGITDDFAYDQSYRLTKNGQWATYEYYRNNQLKYAFGQMAHQGGIRYDYDELNRLSGAQWPIDSSSKQPQMSQTSIEGIEYQYDAFGNLTHRRLNKVGSQSPLLIDHMQFEEDSHRIDNKAHYVDRLTHALPDSAAPKINTQYTLDDAGNTTHRLYSAANDAQADIAVQAEVFAYNAANRLSSVTQNGNVKARYHYNALGQRSQVFTDNSSVHKHYSLSGQLIAETNSDGKLLKEYAYLHGKPLAMFDNSVRRNKPIWHDAQGNPVEDNNIGQLDTSDGSQSFYQAKMNGDGTLELLVKLNGRSIKQGPTHIGFTLIDENNAGDTNIIDFALAAQTRRVPLPIYDGENIVLPLKQDKRIEFTSIKGNKQFPTKYNWVKLVRTGYVFTLYGSSDGTNWNFIDDTYRLVPHQLDLQVSSQNARFNLDKFTSIEIAEPTFYFHNDHLGSPKVMTNVSGQQIWKSDLAPYGESMGEEFRVGNLNVQGTMTQVDSTFRFPGQYADGLTGLNYNYFRDYDPSLGRYIQSDPIGLGGGINTYGYVQGNPVKYSDSYGLYTGVDDAAFAIGGALVGLVGQGFADILSGEASGWTDYAGAAIGGALAGEALLYLGPVAAGAIGGAATNVAKQGLKYLADEDCEFNWDSLAFDTAVGGAIGYLPGVKIPGVTSGRGSHNAVFKQMSTKLKERSISNVKVNTTLKMFNGRAADTNLILGAEMTTIIGSVGAINGIGED